MKVIDRQDRNIQRDAQPCAMAAPEPRRTRWAATARRENKFMTEPSTPWFQRVNTGPKPGRGRGLASNHPNRTGPDFR